MSIFLYRLWLAVCLAGLAPGGLSTANGNATVGRLSSGAVATDRYDFENHLIDRNNGQITIIYDGDGNRVSKTVSGVTTFYLVDDLNPTGYAQVLEELSTLNSQLTTTHVYTYGHALLAQDRLNGPGWTASFFGYDGHNNVRYLTDTLGQITDTYDYEIGRASCRERV